MAGGNYLHLKSMYRQINDLRFVKILGHYKEQGKVIVEMASTCIVMQEASDAHSKTADSDTVSTYQVYCLQFCYGLQHVSQMVFDCKNCSFCFFFHHKNYIRWEYSNSIRNAC